jgi:hypothetical protein
VCVVRLQTTLGSVRDKVSELLTMRRLTGLRSGSTVQVFDGLFYSVASEPRNFFIRRRLTLGFDGLCAVWVFEVVVRTHNRPLNKCQICDVSINKCVGVVVFFV